MEPDRHPDISSLIALISDAATADAIDVVKRAIERAVWDEVDPYILGGLLVEGIAMTVLNGVPEQDQAEIARDAIRRLYRRLQTMGLFVRT